MSTTAVGIALPRWYAHFAWSGGESGAPPLETRDALRRVGPIAIYRADEGCQVALAGDPADPLVVLFDGYILDRARLTRTLDQPAGSTEAAVVASAYARWGADVFDTIDGSYLAAIWDPRERRLLLGHDPLGHHPVFYADRPGGFWFSSNVLALPASGAVPDRPNRVSLALAALTSWPASGETFFEEVRRLRPGHYLSLTPGVIREVYYWSPWLADDEPGLSEHEALEQFEPTLVEAIGRCMELGPDHIMLSGGLDSVTIAALAADFSREHGTPLIRAVSGRRKDPPSDEEPMQSAVAAALHMDHLVTYESDWVIGSKVEMSLDATSELPGPSRIWWAGAYMAFYRDAAARGARIGLTGSGGDNWVSVVDAFAAHAMSRGDVQGVIRHMRSWMGTGGLTFKAAVLHLLWSGGLRLILDSYSARLVPGLKRRYHQHRAVSALPQWLCPDRELRQALAETLYSQRPAALTREGRVPRNFYRHAQRSTVNPYFQYEFEVGFHVESACGLRLLSPYHDRAVVRFLNSIPPHVLLHGDSYKGMLRPLAERRLPNLGLTQQRKVYAAAVRSAQLEELRHGVDVAWRSHSLERLSDLGLIELGKTRTLLDAQADQLMARLTKYALMSADRWLSVHAMR